jgi:hypothetical protein
MVSYSFVSKLRSSLKHDAELLSTIQILSEMAHLEEMTNGEFPRNVIEDIMIKSTKAKNDVLSISEETIEILKCIIEKRECGSVLLYIVNTIDPMEQREVFFSREEDLAKKTKVELIEMIREQSLNKPAGFLGFTKSKKNVLVKLISSKMKRGRCGMKKLTEDKMERSGTFAMALEATCGKVIWSQLHQRMVDSCKKTINMM